MGGHRIKKDPPINAMICLDNPAEVEDIWLQKLPGRRNRYRTLTIPFWTYNLSKGDEVDCHGDEDGLGNFIGNILRKSGNRTVRVGFHHEKGINCAAGRQVESYLRDRGLEFEVAEPALFAINLQKEQDHHDLLRVLAEVPSDARMEWEDGDPQPKSAVGGADTERYRVKSTSKL
jgi:hypothetical protein